MKRFAKPVFHLLASLALVGQCAAAELDHSGLVRSYGKLPVTFIENQGQAADQVMFVVRGTEGSAFFTSNSVVFRLTQSEEETLRISFVSAGPDATVEGWSELPGKVNYLIGSDPSKWKKNVPTYQGVAYRNVWPGVDVIYRGAGRRLKYDIHVSPGADAGDIRLRYEGAEGLSLAKNGDLIIRTTAGSFREVKPCIYQERDGERILLDGRFALRGNTVGFRIRHYDPALPLIIDPATDLIWSTFLGGSGNENLQGVAVDSSGNLYVSGYSSSTDYPTTTGAYDTSHNGGYGDVVVAKLNSSGSSLTYCTFIGGSGSEGGQGLALDSAGCVYVAGGTSSSDLPTTTGAFDKTYNGNTDGFICKLSADGSTLLASTYLGGASGMDSINRITLDSSGNVYVTGATSSMDYPTTSGAYQTTWNVAYDPWSQPVPDVLVSKLNASLSTLAYSTFLGGSNWIFPYPETGRGIAVDSSGCIYVAGETHATDFPTTTGALRTTHNGFFADSFVTKFNSSGSALVYSTFLGGMMGRNEIYGMTLDSSGCVYVTGATTALDFPTTSGAFDTTYAGNGNAFVSKLNSSGSGLVASTFLGGTVSFDAGYVIALAPSGDICVAGSAGSSDFPTTLDAYDRSLSLGTSDAFVAKLNSTCSALIYSTFLGGSAGASPLGITLDSQGRVYVVGGTGSSDFPTTTGAFDTSWNGGGSDAFAAKLQLTGPSSISSAKLLGDTLTIARTWGIVTLVTGAPATAVYYIESEDRSCGIRVEDPSGLAPNLGERVDVAGTLKTNSDLERYVEVGGFFRNGTGSVSPITLTNRDVGGADWNFNAATGAGQKGVLGGSGTNNIGLLIATTGTVTATGTDPAGNNYFLVDDGSALTDASGLTGLRVLGTVPNANPVGRVVVVTGVSSCYKSGNDLYRFMLSRSQSDVVVRQ